MTLWTKQNWEAEKSIRNPLEGLRFIEIDTGNWFSLAFRADAVACLELPSPVPRFPDIENAPELKKYCFAKNGLRLRLHKRFNHREKCYEICNLMEVNIEHPLSRLKHRTLRTLTLIYDPFPDSIDDPEHFIEIHGPWIAKYYDGYGDEAGNWLQRNRFDEQGNLCIEILPDINSWEDSLKLPLPDGLAWDIPGDSIPISNKLLQRNQHLYEELDRLP